MHDKQFVIINNDLFIEPKYTKENLMELLKTNGLLYKSVDFNGKYTILYSPALNVEVGSEGVLLGNAYRGDRNKKSGLEIINSKCKNVIDEYEHLNGRWVMLYGDELHMDAFGTLGIYYCKINNVVICSSSMALLYELFSDDMHFRPYVPIHRVWDMVWYFGPLTRISEIRHLLITQILDLNTGNVKYRNTVNHHDFTNMSKEQIYDEIYLQQKTTFDEILSEGKNQIELSLTAGRDSRLQLAMLCKMGITFSAHTFERKKSTAYSDSRVPKLLSNDIGFPYRYIESKKRDNFRVIEYNRHTFDNSKDMDWEFHYPGHQFDDINTQVYIRSSYWESFVNYYSLHNDMKCSLDNTIKERIDDLSDVFDNIYGNPLFEESLNEYCEWVDQTPMKYMTWSDRFSMEQLFGCWMGDMNQGMDLILPNCLFFHPANSMRIASLIAALPREDRDSRVWEEEMINRFYPKVGKYPYNETRKYDSIIQKIKRIIGR